MAIELGTTDINKVYLGSTEIKKAYLGSTAIFDNTGGSPPVGDGSMKDIVASCVCDFDANVAATFDNLSGSSFDGWLNLVTSPADGASQSAYNLQNGNGSGSNVMIFGGTIGSGGYISVNNNDDYLQQISEPSTTPALANAHLNSTATKKGYAFAFRLSPAQGQDDFFGNVPATGTVGNGFKVYMASNERIGVAFQKSTSGATYNTLLTGILVANTDYLLIGTWDGETNTMTHYLNGIEVSTGTAGLVGDGESTTKFKLGMTMDATTNIYHFSFYDDFLTSTDAANIKAEIESRSGLTF